MLFRSNSGGNGNIGDNTGTGNNNSGDGSGSTDIKDTPEKEVSESVAKDVVAGTSNKTATAKKLVYTGRDYFSAIKIIVAIVAIAIAGVIIVKKHEK